MTTLKNTPENLAKVNSLKKIKETQWVGTVTHNNIEKCLIAINLFQGSNSGWYNPTCVKIKGLLGYFMINEDGGLNFESRVMKISEDEYLIEHLTNEAYNIFEKEYIKAIN